jgi:hypothetical protein
MYIFTTQLQLPQTQMMIKQVVQIEKMRKFNAKFDNPFA